MTFWSFGVIARARVSNQMHDTILVCTCESEALPVPVTNPSFELPPLGDGEAGPGVVCSPIELDTDGAILRRQDGRAPWARCHGSRNPVSPGDEVRGRVKRTSMTPKELAGALRRQLNPRRARWQKPAAVVRALGLLRGQVVAEIGSGPGYFTPRLARAVGPSGHVYAVDPEAAVLDVLRRRLGRIRVRNVTPVLSRDDDPLLPRGRCDVALLINAYHHMRGRTAFLRRLVASLPRSARVVNIDWNEETEFGPPPRRRVPRARFLRDARRAGLRLVAARSFLPHQYFLVLRRGR